MVSKYFGVACPILKEGACSVYEHQPLTCRTHTNLAATAFFCDTAIKPEWSFVPSVDMLRFNLAYGWLLRDEVAADIRDFFPPD
jgi:Fe-S-cluster containining protein